MKCFWKLTTEAEHAIYISIDELVLQTPSNCSTGYLEFDNQRNIYFNRKKYCDTLTAKAGFMQSIRGFNYKDLTISLLGPTNKASKFKLEATSMKCESGAVLGFLGERHKLS